MAQTGSAFSLKRRLLIVLLSVISLVSLGNAVYSYFDVRHEVNRLLDAHLAQSASLIVAQVGQELREVDVEHAPDLHKRGRRVAFQVWEDGRTLRLHSVNAPAQRLSQRDAGFSNETIDGKRWRVLSSWDAKRRFLVQVGERDEARREIAANVATNLLAPLLFVLPALGLLAWFSISSVLRPLNGIGQELAVRRPDNLAPLAVQGVPVEVTPLVTNLNSLFARVSSLIENERRFTADAAHELRTPLAALKTQVQVALGAASDAARRRALDNVVAACDRASRLVDQLLTLARLDPEQFAGRKETCDLRALARQTIADLAPMAVAKRVSIELVADEDIEIAGYPVLISILVRNLVDNAVRYSRPEGAVEVQAAVADGAALLRVTDQGPGIPAPDRAKVGQRFYRILGTEESGSGLGLSIVYRIAELHGATVSLGDGPDGGGLRVHVTFPRNQHSGNIN